VFLYGEAYSEAASRLFHPQFTRFEPNENTQDISHAGQKGHIVPFDPKDEGFYTSPMTVLDAFAVELYLKCLYILDCNKHPPKKHDFLVLFERLTNKGTKDSIRLLYGEYIKISPIAPVLQKRDPKTYKEVLELERYLELSGKVFEDVRYFYGWEGKSKMFYWPMLRLAVRKTILAIEPMWTTEEAGDPLQPKYQVR
jgi:HEPN domain-containing protein